MARAPAIVPAEAALSASIVNRAHPACQRHAEKDTACAAIAEWLYWPVKYIRGYANGQAAAVSDQYHSVRNCLPGPRLAVLVTTNIFSCLYAPSVPMRIDGAMLYFAMTDISGSYKAAVDLVWLGSEEVIIDSFSLPFEYNDKTKEVELVMRLKTLSFSEFGKYVLRLTIDGKFISEKTIWIIQRDST